MNELKKGKLILFISLMIIKILSILSKLLKKQHLRTIGERTTDSLIFLCTLLKQHGSYSSIFTYMEYIKEITQH